MPDLEAIRKRNETAQSLVWEALAREIGSIYGGDPFVDIDVLLAEVESRRTILLQFIGSLTLCDHMGDVSNDVLEVLERIGLNVEWDEWSDLSHALAAIGITTLNGVSLAKEDNE